jgi:hypothetical protein
MGVRDDETAEKVAKRVGVIVGMRMGMVVIVVGGACTVAVVMLEPGHGVDCLSAQTHVHDANHSHLRTERTRKRFWQCDHPRYFWSGYISSRRNCVLGAITCVG